MLEKRSLGTLKRTNSEDSLNERFKDKEYVKHFIIVPGKIVSKLNWKPGKCLKCAISKGKLIIEEVDKE